MELLSTILWPIVAAMDGLLRIYIDALSSVGLSIICLSLTFSVLMIPVLKKTRVVEQRLAEKSKAAHADLAAERGDLKGEALFNLTEKIYKRHGYHPIHAIGASLSLIAMLPVLISSILLLTKAPELAGHSFGFIPDLSQPDHLIAGVNFLPILMFILTGVDAMVRYKGDKGAQGKFLFISVVLLALVYNMAAGLVLYWITSNLFSFAMVYRVAVTGKSR